MKKYYKCENCSSLNELKTEYQTFCNKCNYKLENNYQQWKLSYHKSFEEYKEIVCISKYDSIDTKKTKKNIAKIKQHFYHYLFITLNVLITIFFIYSLKHTGSEFAGVLISMENKFIVFINFILSILAYFIIIKISKTQKILIYILLIVTLTLLNIYLSYKVAFPFELTQKDLYKKSIKSIENNKLKSEQILKNGIIYKPNSKIIDEDTILIKQQVKYITNRLNEQIISKQIDSALLSKFENIFQYNRNYTKYFIDSMLILSSIQCDLINYSPDYKHFVTLLTYQIKKENFYGNKYNGILLFCEKRDSKILCFTYSNSLYAYVQNPVKLTTRYRNNLTIATG